MDKIIIKNILNFLDEEKIDYTFKGNENDVIEGFSTLFNYKNNSMTFVSSLNDFNDYKDQFKQNTIKLVLTSPNEKIYNSFNNIIQTNKPKSVFFKILASFFNETEESTEYEKNEEYANSYVDKEAVIGENVKIGKGCIIEKGVIIGSNTCISHNVVIKSNTVVGENCTVFSGVVIGERGFNPSTEADGSRRMLDHYGGVIIENDVHIGENSVIAKGSIDDTVLKTGVKLNTQVHIAHNCYIGKNTVITMPTHVSGSVIIGESCHIAATTIRNQCVIGDNAVLGLGSVVVKNVNSDVTVVGNPAKPMKK